MEDKGNEHVLFKLFITFVIPHIISLDQEEYQRMIRYIKNIGSRETRRFVGEGMETMVEIFLPIQFISIDTV